MTASDLVDITATLKHETELAYLIDDGIKEVWVPKSRVEKAEVTIGVARQTVFEFTMPRWLAHDKGLI